MYCDKQGACCYYVSRPPLPSIIHTIVQTTYDVGDTAILEPYFGPESLTQGILTADGVHDLRNLPSISTGVRYCFSNLEP